MTFLNATLIFGLAATAIPIVLHLIARREPRKVIFPSIRFLTKKFESNRSRLRVRRWWLLALRILAVAMLALALARPAIHQSLSITWLTIGLIAALGVALLVMASVALARSTVRSPSRSTAYGLATAAVAAIGVAFAWGAYTYASGPKLAIDQIEPVSIAIVLDNSPTSAWATSNDDRIGRIQDVATWMVTRLPRTSRIAIIDRSAQVVSFSLDTSSAVSKIEQLRPLDVTQPLASRLEAAARLVRTSDLPNRQVLLISDLAESTWSDTTRDASLPTLMSEAPTISLTIFDLGEFEGANRSLSIPKFSDATPPRGSLVSVSTMLGLSADDSTSSVSVTAELEMYVNDPSLPVVRDGSIKRPQLQSVDRTSSRVAPGGTSELLLTIPSLDTGTHHGRIRLIGDDALAVDDIRYFTLQVLAAAKVLLVSHDLDEAHVLSQTMTAAAGMMEDENAEFAVDRIEYTDLPVVQLGDFDALVLIDPPGSVLRDDSITEFASYGGGVLVCLGPSVKEPTLESSLVPTLVRRWRTPDPGTFFQVRGTSHPVTQDVTTNTPWGDFRVQQYWQLKPDSNDTVLIQYAGTSHPALVQRLIRNMTGGQPGRVLVLSTPIPALSARTRTWNELFGSEPWPAWLLTRQSIEYITGRGNTGAMLTVGTPKVIHLESQSASESTFPEASAAADTSGRKPQRIQLFPPGDTSPVPINLPPDAKQVTVTDTSRAGTYWIRGLAPGEGFSANLPNQAIQLERIGSTQLDEIFTPGGYTLATDREGIEFAENEATQRVSLHSPAILLALAIFLLEQVLSNRFYRARNPAAAF